jgi:hypothetical protein
LLLAQRLTILDCRCQASIRLHAQLIKAQREPIHIFWFQKIG